MFEIRNVTALPASPVAHTLYFVSTAVAGTPAECYVTDQNGDPRQFGNTAFIQAIVNSAVASAQEMKAAADIAARDALTLTGNTMVLVTDASADPTVTAGAAMYFWDNAASSFVKVSEFESLDVVQTWAAITDGPASTPAQVDAAVANSHTHANKAEIDKIGEDANGNATYGSEPLVKWTETAW